MGIRRTKRWTDKRSALTKAVQGAVRAAGAIAHAEMREGLGTIDGPNIQSGKLKRSIKMDRSRLRSKTEPKVRVGSNSPYAKAHEFGGTVTAKDGYLTIPLNREAKAMRKKKGGLRQFKLTTIRSQAGNLLMGKQIGKKKTDFKPLFLLKKSIQLPARPFVRPSFKRAKPKIIRLFRNLMGARIAGYGSSGAPLSSRQTSIAGYRP